MLLFSYFKQNISFDYIIAIAKRNTNNVAEEINGTTNFDFVSTLARLILELN